MTGTNNVLMYHRAMAVMLPDPDEIPGLVAKPGSAVWRYSGDARLIGTGAYAILLQVAHPTVGAGVTEHSDFRADPWGRLLRTLDYSYVMTYGGPALAGEMGGRIREMHKHIKGVKPDGQRYHALEPEAYAWVHATLADSIVRGSELLARPIPAGELEAFWAEWRRGGRLIGVRERDLPETWADFGAYFEDMTGRLERTTAVDEVLESARGAEATSGPAPVGEGLAPRPRSRHAPHTAGHRGAAQARSARALRDQVDPLEGAAAAGGGGSLAGSDPAAAGVAAQCRPELSALAPGGNRPRRGREPARPGRRLGPCRSSR